jgi:transposase-like protein
MGVVNAGRMKSSPHSPGSRSARSDAASRSRWLAAFDRSGLSAAAFARRHGINYTTFCGWRQRAKSKLLPAFVQVELPATTPPPELTIELGGHARLHLHSAAQIELAARLVQAFNAKTAC